jgi:UDP-N-acetylmuramate dehydrogenase
MEIFDELKKYLPGVKQDVSLREYSTFRIGGLAKYLFVPKNKAELKMAIEKAIELGIEWRILGGGSNTLISSSGFNGLAIIFKSNGAKADFKPIKLDDNNYYVETMASCPLFFLVSEASENNLSGMEWAIGIPGTIAGAINGNAGAFNYSIGEQIDGVEVLEIKNDFVTERYFTLEDCEFGYRDSIFKSNPNLIIVSVKIRLKEDKQEKIKERMKENIAKRSGKQPQGFSIGSIFKNYTGVVEKEIIDTHEQIKVFAEKGAIPAGYLIEQCGLKGTNVGEAVVSNEHANFIVNSGNATSEEVLALICQIKTEVKNKFKIDLEEEIKIF